MSVLPFLSFSTFHHFLPFCSLFSLWKCVSPLHPCLFTSSIIQHRIFPKETLTEGQVGPTTLPRDFSLSESSFPQLQCHKLHGVCRALILGCSHFFHLISDVPWWMMAAGCVSLAMNCQGSPQGRIRLLANWLNPLQRQKTHFCLFSMPLQKVYYCLCSRQTCPKIPRFDLAIKLRNHQTQSLHPPLSSWSKFIKWQLCCVWGCPALSTSSCFHQLFLYLLITYTSVPPVWWGVWCPASCNITFDLMPALPSKTFIILAPHPLIFLNYF